MTDLSKANDKLEGSYFKSEFKKWAHEKSEFMERLDALEDFEMDYSAFAACFSSDQDNLGQWRAYAGDGRGFSLGFDLGELINIHNSDYSSDGDEVVLVEQRIEQQKIVYGEIPEEAFEEIKSATAIKAFREGGWSTLFTEKDIQLVKDYYKFKHKSFLDEKEVRVLRLASSITETDIVVDFQGGRLISRIEVGFQRQDRCALKRICIGPKSRVDKETLRAFLKRLGLQHIEITQSLAPYR
ncbi:DUF2971 domain-containing protein [Leisingera sp. ANG-DT]|uniref:DUF2971 domain-containing protein n=1 Tax=Leisingera sp. ANG-DT TaxID=1577897 RepID=UPI0005808013|nr:DUF2971 domain-containing protein [Leisingera sp. ANG-DT]KIC15117.1 hypothetical protein RA21_17880 [Leisingera sp. ANG-DT]